MIYPHNFEIKIGFTEIRRLLRGECLSTLGSERVDQIAFSDDAEVVLKLIPSFFLVDLLFNIKNFFCMKSLIWGDNLLGSYLVLLKLNAK